jgi:dihydrolipoamide dehydrogenase
VAQNTQYDLVVVGAGPGGYVAAIRGAQLGLRTAIVEKWNTLGGTCLNIGCIPSKALLDSSEFYYRAKTDASSHGFTFSGLELDLGALHKKKAEVVKRLVSGVSQLMKSNKIDVYTGRGALVDAGTVRVTPGGVPAGSSGAATTSGDGSKPTAASGGSDSPDSPQDIQARNVILASGSVPAELPFLPFDGERIVSSKDALEFDEVPEELVVVGAGAIGLELGSVWARLGSKVSVVEIMPEILPTMDAGLGKAMRRELKKQGLDIQLETKVTGARNDEKSGKTILTATAKDGSEKEFPADKVLVAVGRQPYTEGLGAEELGLAFDGKRIAVDQHYRTNVDGVYAIGDLIAGPMLAHKAEDEGIAAAEIIAGRAGHVNYEAIPNVVYTAPEVASVGKTEEQLKEEGIEYRTGSFPFQANGRALAMDSRAGFVKILADAETDRILGVHILGPMASDLIAEAVTAMEFSASAEDLARTVHAHPTLPEAVKEAALSVDGRSIHGK